jgi:AbrB family looped-hinge helix DNA binding protein
MVKLKGSTIMKNLSSQVDKNGRIVLPSECRKELGVKPGDRVIILIEDGKVRLLSVKQAIKEAQEIVRSFVPEGVSLADELIRERREEAARE